MNDDYLFDLIFKYQISIIVDSREESSQIFLDLLFSFNDFDESLGMINSKKYTDFTHAVQNMPVLKVLGDY